MRWMLQYSFQKSAEAVSGDISICNLSNCQAMSSRPTSQQQRKPVGRTAVGCHYFLPGVELWKRWFLKVLVFFGFLNQNLERSIFCFLMVFRFFFSHKFCAQTIIFYYNFIFNLHEFTHPLASTA